MPSGTDQIKLKPGESSTIKLKGLATAGYAWNYTTDGNKDCIKVSKDFVMPGTSAKPGASADEVFTITAKKPGKVNICFSQQRSWEKNADPVNEKKVTVLID
jgi:predicted secreted protein